MAAQTQPRDPGEVLDQITLSPLDVAASTVLYAGGLVCRDASGNAVPAGPGAGKVYGVSHETVDNSAGSAGDLQLEEVRQGIFHFVNDGTDPVTDADLMNPVYALDDQTIQRTQNAAGDLPVAGILLSVDADEGCAVLVGGQAATAGGGLVAVPVSVPDVSTASSTGYETSPVNGKIVAILGTLQAAITGSSATVTTNIGGSPVTGGDLTIDAGAAGTGDRAEPTAANTVAVGDALTVVSDGASTDPAELTVLLLVQAD